MFLNVERTDPAGYLKHWCFQKSNPASVGRCASFKGYINGKEFTAYTILTRITKGASVTLTYGHILSMNTAHKSLILRLLVQSYPKLKVVIPLLFSIKQETNIVEL